MTIGRLLAVVAISASVLTACGDDDDTVASDQSTTSSSSLSPTTVAQAQPIVIRDFSFSNLDVRAGSKVLVQNNGQEPHTLTADDRTFDTGLVQPGRNVELAVPSRTGTYKIRCLIHPDRMTGELKVT